MLWSGIQLVNTHQIQLCSTKSLESTLSNAGNLDFEIEIKYQQQVEKVC